jgi:uncharacterized protein YjbI with pentapeptide repeats
VAEQGHVTDRFTRAVSQLGDQAMDVRLGGIYGLERLTRDSPRDQPAVVEVLAAYIRNRVPTIGTPACDAPPPKVYPSDLSAAIAVLSRRDRTMDNGAWADLAFVCYPPLLTAGDYRRFSFQRASLPGAYFYEANLTGADFANADLTGANLAKADLTGARLYEAKLTDADLTDADLTDADLTDADLTDADLTGARLARADLTGARLAGADLTGARLAGADLTGADLTGADLTGADLTGAFLTEADLTGADLTGAIVNTCG